MLASFFSHVPAPLLFAIPVLAIMLPFVFLKDAKDRSRGIMPAPKDVRAAGKGEPWDKLNEHHTPILSGSRKELATSTPARLLAPSTPYALCHGNPVDSLSLSDPDATTQMLSRDWGISDRNGLLSQVYDLLREGHREDFENLRRKCTDPAWVSSTLARLDKKADEDTYAWEKRWRIHRLLNNDRRIQSIDFAAWDFLRAAMLTRAGAVLGMLSADEAWEAFRTTRWFWAAEGQAQEAANDLHDRNRGEFLVGKNGLWTAIPWDAPYPEPRFLILDALAPRNQLRTLSRQRRERSSRWELEIDDQTQARLGFTLP